MWRQPCAEVEREVRKASTTAEMDMPLEVMQEHVIRAGGRPTVSSGRQSVVAVVQLCMRNVCEYRRSTQYYSWLMEFDLVAYGV